MLRYRSGEAIKTGDRIRYHGNAAEIEFVADPETVDAESEWYVKEFGGGVMLVDSLFGHIFISNELLPYDEDLEFVARSEG